MMTHSASLGSALLTTSIRSYQYIFCFEPSKPGEFKIKTGHCFSAGFFAWQAKLPFGGL